MTRVAVLAADLIANSSSFETGLARANSAMRQSKSQWNSALASAERQFDSVTGKVVAFGGALAASFSVVKVATDLKAVVNEMDSIGKASDRLGIATESLSKLAYVGKLAGVDLEELEKSIRTLQKTIIGAQDGSKTLAQDFVKLGLSTATLRGLKVEDAFALVVDRLTNMKDAYLRNTIAQELFGKSGLKMINLAAGQADGLRTLYGEATKLGLVFDREAAAKAEAFNDSLTRLGESYKGLLGSFANTGAITAMTSAINALANNMGTLATAALALTAVFSVRLLNSALLLGAAWIANQAQVTALTVSLATLTYGSRAAGVAMTILTGATNALGAAIAFLGGPLGVAILGTLALMVKSTNAAADAQKVLNQQIVAHQAASAEYITASANRRRAIEDDTRANIESYKKELEGLKSLATALDNENVIFRLSRNLGSKLGIDTSAADVKQYAANVQKEIDALTASLKTFDKVKNGTFGVTGGTGVKNADTFKNIIFQLKEQSDQLEIQNRLAGQQTAAINRVATARRIDNELKKEGVELDYKQQQQLADYITLIYRQELQQDQIRRNLEATKEAFSEFGSEVKSDFSDLLKGAEKFDDFLKNLGQHIEDLLLKLVVEQPLDNFFTSLFRSVQSSAGSGGGGFFGDIFGGIFGGLSGNASGTDFVPRDMITKVHRGEEIVTARDARAGGPGVDVTVNITNNTGAQVSAQARQTSQGVDIEVMVDEMVAGNISKTGTKTNAALQAMRNQALIKR